LKKQSQSPAFGWKFEALNQKSEGNEWVSNEKAQFEKTKPICRAMPGNSKHKALNPKKSEWTTNVRTQFEKTKPICNCPNWRKFFENKII
jgi:hypothetical protein